MQSICREYDIRGIYEKELNEQTVKLIGYFLGKKILAVCNVVAIGYDEDGKEVATRPEFYLVGAEGNILEWTKWDLSALGKVVKIDFNVTGSNDNGYGFSQPAYFAYDDVAVRF